MQNLHQLQELFERYLTQNTFEKTPAGLYEPVNYVLGLGGKRLRPAVVLMAYQLFDDSVERALPAALAIEIFHNFTLLHDDIMDQAPLRRGKPTVHEKFGINAGILSGDVMLAYAYDFLLRTEPKPKIPALLRIFSKAAIEVCEGQQMDMDFERRQDVSIPEYLKMIELKTSVLVAAALEMGALLGGAKKRDAKRLYEFGRNLGIAFQLQDDLLDTFGDPAKFGKKTGGDIAQNKKTYLYLKALEVANPSQRAQLLAFYQTGSKDETGKIEQVTKLFTQLKISALTEKIKAEFERKAMRCLEAVKASPQKKEVLNYFAATLMNREM